MDQPFDFPEVGLNGLTSPLLNPSESSTIQAEVSAVSLPASAASTKPPARKRPMRRKIDRSKINTPSTAVSTPDSTTSSTISLKSSQASAFSVSSPKAYSDLDFFNLDTGEGEEEEAEEKQKDNIKQDSINDLPNIARGTPVSTPDSMHDTNKRKRSQSFSNTSQTPMDAVVTEQNSSLSHNESNHIILLSDDDNDTVLSSKQYLLSKVRDRSKSEHNNLSTSDCEAASHSLTASPSPGAGAGGSSSNSNSEKSSQLLQRSEEEAAQEIQRIKERMLDRQKRRKMAEKNPENSFHVTIVLRTKIAELEMHIPPFFETVKSTDSLGPIFNKYRERAKEFSDKKHCNIESVVFVWKNKILFPTSTPQILKVTEETPTLLIDAMLQAEFDYQNNEDLNRELQIVESDPKQVFEERLKQEMKAERQARKAQEEREKEKSAGLGEDGDGYFRIKLRGKDNVPISVKVRAQTTMKSLVEYYCKNKKIDETQWPKVRLVFDDDDLDMDGTVGDTELEEDFTVEVYID